MCGFAGKVNTNHIELNSNIELRMKAALKSLHPRGPDHQGIYTDEYSYLVHARLSIIDTSSNGSQPMNKYNKTIVYNGEIYNYKELKIILKKNGYKFFSNSDTEVLLAAWDMWGEEALNYINGMFAFAIWDKLKKELTLVRDPFGKKPLLYSINNKEITFASDLNSLEKIIDNNQINPLAVESLFKLRFIHDPLTIYENVYKLLPGHIITFSDKEVKNTRWYNLLNYSQEEVNHSFITNNIRNYFDEAVKRRLVSDVDVGVFLSGGLDSSLIVASIAEQGFKYPCFTMGFAGASNYYEERPQAARLAKYYGMKHEEFEIDETTVIKNIPEILEACDEPFADTSAIPFYMLSKQVSSNVKVVLSGDGGDEVFGGYRKHIGEKWSALPFLIPKFIREIIINLLIENKNTSLGEVSRKIRRYLMNISREGSERQANWLEQINENTIKNLLGDNLENTKNLLEVYRSPFKDPINSMLAADLGFSLPGDMLVKTDRMSMANSLEIRSPFLDKNLVEYAFSLPGNLKIGSFKGKKLLKESFKKRLPRWSMSAPKKGFEIPIADWLKSDLKSLVEDSCSKKNLDRIGIKDPNIVDEWRISLNSGKRDTSWQLWTLISYSKWLEAKGKL
jgi:asparagine synthase (glutamine-hydrolysing)